MDEATVKDIATTAAKVATHECLLQLGIDTHDPLEVQADMAHLRRVRTATESLRLKKGHVILGIVISGTATILLLGFQEFFRGVN